MVKIPSLKSMSASYIAYHKSLIKNYKFMEKIKMGFSIFLFLLAIWAYGYFVNVASTKWYFIRVENEKLSEVKFQNEIVNIDTKKMEGEILNNILPANLDTDNLTWKVLVLRQNMKEVAYNK